MASFFVSAKPLPEQELAVGELSQRTGVAISTLHFYEKKGLIKSFRNSSNHRRYPRDVIRVISVIKIAQSAGISLFEIKQQFARLTNQKKVTIDDWKQLSAAWHDTLNNRINTLTALRDNIDGCIGCGCLSMSRCQLVNPEDIAAQQGPGPHIDNDTD
ncbi:redox-sensitive transcriptional activator SoxR [Thalassotalea litorea]|uniref:Redox-sensitive transcriptional activator SoxR n=1 Tax=Thalassotalea litorea TaxID=2020715 RepID=A0A5R9IPV7_9GAMM|nr:redox-sensitive transcriptional activator SoxR [Thalassotalea litorea]TLU66639.1 redox-sensitive transcriptional activator SoxR [Thalassotalea litorea]